MAGGEVKPGFTHGATGEFGYYAVEDRMHVHDLARATIVHLPGLDHGKLNYFYGGRNDRLTRSARACRPKNHRLKRGGGPWI